MILSQRFRDTGIRSPFSRKYILLSILYGLSTLIIPLATQYLVNSLALSSLMANTIIFMIILLVVLTFSQILRFSQVVILEFIQREIFVKEARLWSGNVNEMKSHYMLEIQNVMKSFSISWSHLVELGLSFLFGFFVIISLHPAFIILPLISLAALWLIFSFWNAAVASSVLESDEKYRLVDMKLMAHEIHDEDLVHFMKARDHHFTFIKRSTAIVGIAFVLSQLFLLGAGIWFIERSELSVGQLVAAEIILSGIMVSVTKLPKTMESLYDLETSKIKLEKALGGHS